jgi:hypothetical protein
VLGILRMGAGQLFAAAQVPAPPQPAQLRNIALREFLALAADAGPLARALGF